jgi:hypothetical protein
VRPRGGSGYQRKVGIVGKPNLILTDHIHCVTVVDERQFELLSEVGVLERRLSGRIKVPGERLTLARKIASITLLVWKKGVSDILPS